MSGQATGGAGFATGGSLAAERRLGWVFQRFEQARVGLVPPWVKGVPLSSPPARPAKGPALWSRRRWLLHAAWSTPAAGLLHVTRLEPRWLAIRHHRVNPTPSLRIAHFTDVHFRGDEDRLHDVVEAINGLRPDVVVFTGDLVEEAKHFASALAVLAGIRAPLYGIPGNHDHWARADFAMARRVFAATGGRWLQDESVMAADGRLRITGVDRLGALAATRTAGAAFHLVLMHYPIWADRLSFASDLLLAGHSHGGQVRLPWVGALVRPHDVGPYEIGWYSTPAGPLYVNPGIGCLGFDVRFNCRPEVAVLAV